MNKEYRAMRATPADKPFDGEEWVYETKWDGFRLITEVKRDSVRLYSRNGIEVTTRYTAIAQALGSIRVPCVRWRSIRRGDRAPQLLHSGKRFDDLAREALFQPLGLGNWSREGMKMVGFSPAAGLRLRPRDAAKIG
jgi:ATP dependent DNA ligase domain